MVVNPLDGLGSSAGRTRESLAEFQFPNRLNLCSTGIAMFAGRDAVSLSAFGGEGQGEEAVALDIPA